MTSSLLFIYPGDTDSLCYWITDDASREDHGHGCGGFSTVAEVIEEVRDDLTGTDIQVVDLSSLDLEASDAIMSWEDKRLACAEGHATPFETWLSRHE